MNNLENLPLKTQSYQPKGARESVCSLGWGGSNWGLGNSGSLLVSGLLLLEVLGKDFLVVLMSFFTCLPSLLLVSLHDSLSSQSDVGDESLNLW